MPNTDSKEDATGAPPLSTLAPLSLPVFRMLWFTWLAANLCMWMNDVAAAWLMTSLTTSPNWVALVQTASTLPVFILSLPSGALADILDRRRLFLVSQLWIAGVALVLCLAILGDRMTPLTLLVLIFCNGIGLAMRAPLFSAIIQGLVPRVQLPAALALNSISMNASRIAGPLVAGALIASLGSAYVFLLNAALSIFAACAISRWKQQETPHPLGPEKFFSALRVGLQFARQSTPLQGVLLRISLFFFHVTALLGLLPLVARGLPGGGAGSYTLLLGSMGAGAILAAMFMPRLRQRFPRDSLVLRGTTLQSLATILVAMAPLPAIATIAMFVAGIAWITTATSLSVAAQMMLPDWVRARGMSMLQMSIMGASALGAAIWGQIATWTSVQTSLAIAAASGILTMLLAVRVWVDTNVEGDNEPFQRVGLPGPPEPPATGHIQTRIEYRIDLARLDDFRELMEETRRSRLRHGALHRRLFRDIINRDRFIEQVVDESWADHLRRSDHATAAEAALRDRRQALHLGPLPPIVTRSVLEPPFSDRAS